VCREQKNSPPEGDRERNFVHVDESSQLRFKLSFCIAKLKRNEVIHIGGFEKSIAKVIMMVEILKERIGFLHQVNNFTTQMQ